MCRSAQIHVEEETSVSIDPSASAAVECGGENQLQVQVDRQQQQLLQSLAVDVESGAVRRVHCRMPHVEFCMSSYGDEVDCDALAGARYGSHDGCRVVGGAECKVATLQHL
jgi:hypothetical protein